LHHRDRAVTTARVRPAIPTWVVGLGVVVALLTLAVVEWAMGRTPICGCGTVKLWQGMVHSAENSQQILDWYSFTHVTHGFLLYLLTWLLLPRHPFGTRLLVAVLLECAWEIVENSDLVINRYRVGTISYDYFGDSIINSVADVLCMIVGFLLAHRLPVWSVIALAVVSELVLAYVIRDNLTLNALMILYPLQAVKDWQNALLH
jgi:Protein of unknown function (DUF2585)